MAMKFYLINPCRYIICFCIKRMGRGEICGALLRFTQGLCSRANRELGLKQLHSIKQTQTCKKSAMKVKDKGRKHTQRPLERRLVFGAYTPAYQWRLDVIFSCQSGGTDRRITDLNKHREPPPPHPDRRWALKARVCVQICVCDMSLLMCEYLNL